VLSDLLVKFIKCELKMYIVYGSDVLSQSI
jgi:hypothetical protein